MSIPTADCIEMSVVLLPPSARVWQALTDPCEFSRWFNVVLDEPFAPGRITRGTLARPGGEPHEVEFAVERLETNRVFSFRWRPGVPDVKSDDSDQVRTLVEFRLQRTLPGTLLMLSESGFDSIPEHRRAEAFHTSSAHWPNRLAGIKFYLTRFPVRVERVR